MLSKSYAANAKRAIVNRPTLQQEREGAAKRMLADMAHMRRGISAKLEGGEDSKRASLSLFPPRLLRQRKWPGARYLLAGLRVSYSVEPEGGGPLEGWRPCANRAMPGIYCARGDGGLP